MIARSLYENIVREALREDAPFGDPFGEAFHGPASGVFLAGGRGVFCGGPVAEEVFRQVDPSVSVSFRSEGSRVSPGDKVGEASGPAGSLLRAERVALNFLQRLSGVATATSLYAERIAGHGTRLLDTRKTTPLLRVLEKYAVRVGGGCNHRFGLDDAVLIKDNHAAVAGGVGEAVGRARAAVGHLVKIEVETTSLAQVREALDAGAEVILLDNMGQEVMEEAVALVGGRAVTEASGGITPENAAEVAGTGVDVLSLGWLTHSAPALDVALDVVVG